MEFPQIGYGTYKLKTQEDINNALDNAFAHGYRLIDTAELYNNQALIGDYLARHPTVRKDIWITSKVSFIHLKKGEQSIISNINKTFDDLHTDYIDLYLIHAPYEQTHLIAWNYLRKLQKEGRIRHIGLSNFNLEKIKHFMMSIGEEESKHIYCNQIEFSPFFNRKGLIDFLRANNIRITAYGLTYMFNELIADIAKELGKSMHQILLKWALQKDIHIIPMSGNPKHIQENIQLDFIIPDNYMVLLDNINKDYSHYPKYL